MPPPDGIAEHVLVREVLQACQSISGRYIYQQDKVWKGQHAIPCSNLHDCL